MTVSIRRRPLQVGGLTGMEPPVEGETCLGESMTIPDAGRQAAADVAAFDPS